MTTTTRLDGNTITIPDEVRDQLGLTDGAMLIVEASETGILLRPVEGPRSDETYEVEVYSPERIAEFLLSNVMSRRDYEWARDEVTKMGLDPDSILHDPWTE